MIQPALLAFQINNEDPSQPTPVLLDIDSLKNDYILLLDTYFKVVIWEGSTIRSWRKAGYHKKEEYENVKILMESPREYA